MRKNDTAVARLMIIAAILGSAGIVARKSAVATPAGENSVAAVRDDSTGRAVVSGNDAVPAEAIDSQQTAMEAVDTTGTDAGAPVNAAGDTTIPQNAVPESAAESDTAAAVKQDSTAPVIAAEPDSTPPAAALQESTVSEGEKEYHDPLIDTLIKSVLTGPAMTVMELSLDEAIDCLLRHNPLVISTRLEWLASDRKARASLGVFEPSLTGGYKYSDTRYNYRPYPELNLEQSFGVKGRLLSGTDYSIGYRLNDIRHGRSTFDRPQAFSGITATQPLLRGVWFGASLAERKIAETEREIAFHTYRAKIIETVAELQSAYWSAAFAQEKYRFASQSVEIAEKVVHDSRMRLKTGKMSPMDLMEAEAGLAARLANRADAAQELLDAVNQLKLLLSTDKIGNDTLLFCTEKIFFDQSDSAATGGSDTILDFDLHPEFRVRLLERDKETVTLDYRKDRCLPELNAKGSYGFNGFGDRASTALYRLLNDPRPAWSAEIEMGLPLLAGVEARNLLAAQKLNTEAAEKNLSAIEYQIVNSYRIITQRVSALGEHARNAKSVVDFREQLLEVEFKKLNAGKSNNRLIYETEEKLSEARQWQLESNVRYRMAIVQKAKISGSLLRDFCLETVENGRPVISEILTRHGRTRRRRDGGEY